MGRFLFLLHRLLGTQMKRLLVNFSALMFGLFLGVFGVLFSSVAHAQTAPTGIDSMSVPGMIYVASLVFSAYHGFRTGFRP